MRAAEDLALLYNAMPDHATSTVLAGGCQGMNRTFEAVVSAGDAVESDLHRLRVLASTDFTACHWLPSFGRPASGDLEAYPWCEGCNAHARWMRAEDRLPHFRTLRRGMSFASSIGRKDRSVIHR